MSRFFNGTSSVINCGTGGGVGAGSDWTVACWVFSNTPGHGSTFIAKRDAFSAGNNQFEFGLDGSGAALVYDRNNNFQVIGAITQSKWFHTGVANDATSGIAYIDGVGTSTTSLVSGTGTAQTLQIGGLITENTNYFKGMLAHIAVWNVKLLAAEFANLASGALLPIQVRRANLVHYWPLHDRGHVIRDWVGSSHGISAKAVESGPEPPVRPLAMPTDFELFMLQSAARANRMALVGVG